MSTATTAMAESIVTLLDEADSLRTKAKRLTSKAVALERAARRIVLPPRTKK